MKSALYHQTGKKPIPFTVAKTNTDGTINLADAQGVVRVSSCPVAQDPTPGACTLVEDEKVKAKAEAEAKAKAEAEAKAKAEADAKPGKA